MNPRELPVTIGFNNEAIGWLTINSPIPDSALIHMVLAPAYVKKEDGTIQLVEVSLIPAQSAVDFITKGYAGINDVESI